MPEKIKALIMCITLILIVIAVGTNSAMSVTWSIIERRLTTYAYYDGFPAITQTADQKLWLVWSKSILGNLTLYYQTSSDLGITWSEEMNLTEVPSQGNDQNPSIIQAVNGTIWVFWTSDRPPPITPPSPDFTMSASPTSLTIPQGGTEKSNITVTSIEDFNEPVHLSVFEPIPGIISTLDPTTVTPPPGGSVNSTLTVSVEATATPGSYSLEVVGRSSAQRHFVNIDLLVTTAGGSSGSSPSTVAPGQSPTATAAASTSDSEIFFKVSHDNGATWSNDVQLTDNYVDDLRPSVDQLSNGTIVVTWQGYETNNFDILYMTTQDGVSWSSIKQLTTHSANDKAPSITQTSDGKIWVTWSTDRTGDYEIFYKTYNGVSWSEDTRLTYNLDSDVTPAILQAIVGDIYIFWCSMPLGGGGDIYYQYSSDNGVNWSASTRFTTDTNEDMWPALTQTSDRKIRVVWVSNPDDNWDIYYREGRESSLAGDVNLDGVVDNQDLTLLKQAFGAVPGDNNWNPNADLYYDFRIDTKDLQILGENYGAAT